jgi:hypothetical protein
MCWQGCPGLSCHDATRLPASHRPAVSQRARRYESCCQDGSTSHAGGQAVLVPLEGRCTFDLPRVPRQARTWGNAAAACAGAMLQQHAGTMPVQRAVQLCSAMTQAVRS